MPSTAQLEGTPYYSPKLHLCICIPCCNVGMWRVTDTHTHRQAHRFTDGRIQYTFRLVMPNVKCNKSANPLIGRSSFTEQVEQIWGEPVQVIWHGKNAVTADIHDLSRYLLFCTIYPLLRCDKVVGIETELLLIVFAKEVMQSPPSVCPSVCFYCILSTKWQLTLNFCMWVDHDYSSQGIEGQDHNLISRLWVRIMWSVQPRTREVFSTLICSYRYVGFSS